MAKKRPKSKRAKPVVAKKPFKMGFKAPKVKERVVQPPPSRYHRDRSKYRRKKKHHN